MGTRLKQVEAELAEELVFSTFSIYFINIRGWPSIYEDSGNKIQWNYLNLFYPTVLKVSLLDFVANNRVNPGSLDATNIREDVVELMQLGWDRYYGRGKSLELRLT